MSYNSYRTSSAPSRGRGFSSRGTYRGRGSGDGSWNSTSPRGGRGGFSGPSRGRFNWYKEHGSSNFDSRRSYGSGGFSGGSERYSGRGGRAEDSYRRSYHGDVPEYSSRDQSHHRSPEPSQRKRMRTEHSYVQASSGRRSHEGSYGGGTDYNSRYSYDDKGYGEDRSRGYRDERRSAGSFRDHLREDYPHRKADLDSGMHPPSSGPPRHVSSPRGSYRGRVSSRGTRGMSRLTLARRADAIARKRSLMDPYSISKRILTSRAKADYLRRLKIQKLRRIRAIAIKECKDDKETSGKEDEDLSEDNEEEDGELGEIEDWDTEMKKEREEGETDEKDEEKPKSLKKVKKVVKEEEREEGEEVDEEEEGEEEEEEEEEEDQEQGEKEGEKTESPKKSDAKNGGVQVTIKQDSEMRAVSDEIKRTTYDGKPFIKLTCPSCFTTCITFKEYAFHLYSPKHINAMCKQSLRLKQTLTRMRMIQRQKQRTLEENEATPGVTARSRFCPVCKLNYRQFKTKHQLSDYHRTIERFLMPYCRVCRIGFKSPMLYENHICSLNHIKREARLKETSRLREHSKDDGSGMEDEDKEVNLDNFMTLDSVGTVDDDEEEEEGSEGEGEGKSKDKKDGDEKKRTEANLGSEYIKKMEALFCEMCRTYLPRIDDSERALSIHCRSRTHLTRYVRYCDDRSLRREAERRRHRKVGKDANAEKSSVKEEVTAEKMVDSTTEKGIPMDEDVKMKIKPEVASDDFQEMAGEEAGGEKARRDGAEGGEDIDQELEAGMDEKLWADVDKDLGDLLREVEPGNKSSDEDEDSRAEGGRYDRFQYSEKGSSGTGPKAEGEAPDTTKTAGGGEGEGESETAGGSKSEDSTKNSKSAKSKDEAAMQSKKQSPSGGTASSTPAAVTTN